MTVLTLHYIALHYSTHITLHTVQYITLHYIILHYMTPTPIQQRLARLRVRRVLGGGCDGDSVCLSVCTRVLGCPIHLLFSCSTPNSDSLGFAFVEFKEEGGAVAATKLDGVAASEG